MHVLRILHLFGRSQLDCLIIQIGSTNSNVIRCLILLLSSCKHICAAIMLYGYFVYWKTKYLSMLLLVQFYFKLNGSIESDLKLFFPLYLFNRLHFFILNWISFFLWLSFIHSFFFSDFEKGFMDIFVSSMLSLLLGVSLSMCVWWCT